MRQTTALTVLAFAAVLALCSFAKLVLIVLLLAVTVALLFEPVVAWLEGHRVPRAAGSALVIVLVTSSALALGWVFYGRAEAFLSQLPTYRQEIRGAVRSLQERASKLEKTTREVLPQAGDGKQVVPVRNVDQSRLSELLARIGPVGEVLLAISFLPFLSYFMLSWAPHVRVRTVGLFAPENRRVAQASLDQIVRMVRKFVLGNLMGGLIIGAVATVIFGFIGVPFFYFVGFASGFVNLVPYLGVVLAPLPPLIVGLGHLHMTGVIVILVSTVVLHLIALNVAYPKLVGESLRLNPLAGTLGLLFWAWIWGPMGLLFAIPITAALKIICDHVEPLKPYGAWLGTPDAAGPERRRERIARRWRGTILRRSV
jgi:predicted PurR-regulated permease PerM